MIDINVRGDELFLVIEEFVELEWRKFQSRAAIIALPDGSTRREYAKFFPFTTIRFKEEDAAFIAKVKAAVDGYKGSVVWHMFGHPRIALPGTNWVIEPVFINEVREKAYKSGARDISHYVAEHYPDFAPLAYSDLPGLAEHVRKALS
jgi:hypothetical protein